MFVAILLIKNSKRDFLENNKGEFTWPEGIESSSVCSVKALEEGLSGAVTDSTVMVAVDGTDRAAGVGVDISLDSITVDRTERVTGGGAEGGTVMVAVGETGGADIALDGGTVAMAVDDTGRVAGGGGDIALDKLLKAMFGTSSSSIIKSSSVSLSSTLSLWWTLSMLRSLFEFFANVLLQITQILFSLAAALLTLT